MSFLDLAKKRYSVRAYENKAVEKEKIDTILNAGRIAPTAANKQPNKFLLIDDEQSFAKLEKAANLHGAQLAIVICADKNTAWVRPFDKASMVEVDASIAATHMMMCAEDLGLGSCWLTYFDPDIVRKEFNIPENIIPVNILTIGYAAGEPSSSERHSTERKPLEDFVVHKSF